MNFMRRDLPVMAREVAGALRPQDGQIFLDMTFGSGGHTRTLLASKADIKVIALDRDPVAYEKAIELAKETNFRVLPLIGKFSDAPRLLQMIGIRPGQLSGVIIDAGPSIEQFEDSRRGFNINKDGWLDMRMDGNRYPSMPTAFDVINSLPTMTLAKIFKCYGQTNLGAKIAQAIVDARFMMLSIRSTIQLAQLVSSVAGDEVRLDTVGRPHEAATKVFRAIRIFVNNELNELNYAIGKMREFLVYDSSLQKYQSLVKEKIPREEVNGGVLAVLCSNSLEDRIVKDHVMERNITDSSDPYFQRPINQLEEPTETDLVRVFERKWLPLEKFVLFPGEEEILTNPTGKTSKLRCAMRRL